MDDSLLEDMLLSSRPCLPLPFFFLLRLRSLRRFFFSFCCFFFLSFIFDFISSLPTLS